MSLRFLGLSGHLVSGASGHFETFHKGLFKAFKEILGEENCNFLGSQSSEGENLWFEANLPDSLTSTIPFVSKGFLDSAFDSVDEVGNSHILYVYEGNLSNLFLIGNIARRKGNVFIYFNLFNSYKYNSKFESKRKLIVFKLLFLLALRGLEGRIFLTADTKRFADFLSKKLGKTFSEYPMYSALQYKLGSDNQRKRVLINFRFQKSQELIQVAIEKIVDLQEIGLDLQMSCHTSICTVSTIESPLFTTQNSFQCSHQEGLWMRLLLGQNWLYLVTLQWKMFYWSMEMGVLSDSIAMRAWQMH